MPSAATDFNSQKARPMFPALAALQVRDTVALVLLMSCHDILKTSHASTARDVIKAAFELADEFAYESHGRWALDAKAAKRKRESSSDDR